MEEFGVPTSPDQAGARAERSAAASQNPEKTTKKRKKASKPHLSLGHVLTGKPEKTEAAEATSGSTKVDRKAKEASPELATDTSARDKVHEKTEPTTQPEQAKTKAEDTETVKGAEQDEIVVDLEAEAEYVVVLHDDTEGEIGELLAVGLGSEAVEIAADMLQPAMPEAAATSNEQASVPLETLPSGAGGGSGQPPESGPEVTSPEPEPRPPHTALDTLVSQHSMPSEALIAALQEQAAVPSQPNTAIPRRQHEQIVAQAAAAAEQSGRSRGLLLGLLLGGGIEHIRHRRRERRQAKVNQKQFKQYRRELAAVKDEQQTERQHSHRLASQLERLRAVSQTELAKLQQRRTTQAERHSSVERPLQRLERIMHRRPAAERAPAEPTPEAPDELVPLAPGRRLETSAWHRIEVDVATGKAVENPTLEYGREFRREQEAETIQQLNPLVDPAAALAVDSLTAPHALTTSPTSPQPGPSKPLSSWQAKLARERQHASLVVQGVPPWVWAAIIGMMAIFAALILR